MKKVLAVLVLLALIAAAAVVPGKIKGAKSEHEQRMFTAVDALGRSFRSLATGKNLKVGIYSPMADFDSDVKLWSVSGIVGVALRSGNVSGPAAAGNELFEPFAAQLRNNCRDTLSSTCVRVETLTVGGAKVLDTGQGLTPVPGLSSMPMEAHNRAPSLIELQAATRSGGTSAALPSRASAVAGAVAGPALGQPPPRPVNPFVDTGGTSSVRDFPVPPTRPAAPAAARTPTAPAEKARREVKAAAPSKDSPAPRAASGSGGTDVAARPPAAPAQTRAPGEEKISGAVIMRIKRGLKRLGYDPGPFTGTMDPEAFSAIMAYQRRYELKLDGKPSLALLKHIENNKSDSLY